MFLKGFFYMPRSDRRTFTFLCTLILVVVILMGALSNTDDTSNKIESPEKAAKTSTMSDSTCMLSTASKS